MSSLPPALGTKLTSMASTAKVPLPWMGTHANGEGAAFERKNIRASTVTRGDPPEGETQGSDATGFLRATPDLHTQGTDASGFLPSPGGGGFDYGSPENDETQLDEMPAVRDSASLFDLRAASTPSS